MYAYGTDFYELSFSYFTKTSCRCLSVIKNYLAINILEVEL